jgi:hypothetical protein
MHHKRFTLYRGGRTSFVPAIRNSSSFSIKRAKFTGPTSTLNDRQTGVSGIFHAKLDNPTSKDLTGSATGTGKSDKLEAAFHATLK